MAYFFISYKRGNPRVNDFIDELRLRLTAANILIWQDVENMKLGENFRNQINLTLDSCYGVILIMTPESISAEWVIYECNYAIGAKKEIIPIVFEDYDTKSLPPVLVDRHYIRIDGPNFWERLTQRLQEIKNRYMEEVPLPVSLAATALNRPNPEERKQAIEMLKTYDIPNYNPAVIKALGDSLRHGYVDVRVGAAIALAVRTNYESKSVLPPLRVGYVICKKITSEPLLKAFEIPYDIEVLQELFGLQKLIDEKGLLRAIYEIDDSNLKQSLWGIYDNRSPLKIRLEVINCFSNIGNKNDLAQLESLLSNLSSISSDSRELHHALETAISHIKDRESGNFGKRLIAEPISYT